MPTLEWKAGKKILLDLHYLPSIPYFCAIAQSKEVVLDVSNYYQKQSYQTRAYIRNAQGIQALIIPIQHPRYQVPYQDIKIDHTISWLKQHQRSLLTAYNSTPYGEILLEEIIFPSLVTQPTFLIELNLNLLDKFCSFMNINVPISIMKGKVDTRDGLDMRGILHPKKALPKGHQCIIYDQRFTPFIPNLSIVDLLACEGRVNLKT
ncbi:MAG: WbqC family protein [Bacteroidota bacterium]